MTYTRKQERLGMTAIAAVLALSSTPLAAQEATSTDVPLVTVPAPEPVAPAADPLAPTPEQVSTPAETTATEAAEAPEPVAAVPAAKPVARKAAAKAERTPTRTAARAAAPVSAAPAAAATAAEAPAPTATPLVDARPTEPAPVEEAKAKPKIDEAIPIAGGAGAVILALAGAGMAIRRRKRSEEEEGELQDETVLTDEVTPAPAPEPWNPPVVKPTVAPIEATRTDVPEDFETSHFGRHVQAAYAGPTPENPSLSLRKRLKLAGELDRRERLAGTTARAEAPVTPKPAQQPTGFMLSETVSPAKTLEYQF
jgi:hypothetical protein